jgi:hypothetical protein
MWSRLGRPVGLAIGLAAALSACSSAKPPLPTACQTTGPAGLESALTAAPGPVRLPGGTAISTCVDRAGDAYLQQIGTLLSSTADQLAARALASPTVAVDLGYLVGAVRRGAAHSNGLTSQLQQRIEVAAALRGAGPAPLAALHRGIVAGQRSG